jgi:hypothetical protein
LGIKLSQKIPRTAIDVFGAWLYATKKKIDGSPDWCFFTSWLAVCEKSKSMGLGTIDEHHDIFAVVCQNQYQPR